jgi:hypothetical protein
MQNVLGDVPWRRCGVGVAEVHASQADGRDAERAETASVDGASFRGQTVSATPG